MDKTQRALSNFQSSVGSTMKKIGTILGTLAIGKLIKDSTELAMGVESAVNQINRTMGTSAGAFQKWVNGQASAYGMAKSEALKYGAVYSNLISSFAKDTAETTKYTEELLKASAVVASATGRTMEDTMERIRSGMLGSTEAIEDLGINVNVAMIESTNAFKQFANGKSWQQLNFQTQQQIRLMAILEQANQKYGDTLANTTATQMQMFRAELNNVKLSLGQAFMPILNTVLPLLTALASKLAYVMNIVSQFTQALFGKPAQAQAQATAISQQASAANDLGDSLKSAGKEAKKAKGSLAGFDEINNLSKSAGDSGSSGGGSGAGGGAASTVPTLVTPEVDTSIVDKKMKAFVDKIKSYFKTFDFSNLSKAFDRLKNSVTPTINTIGKVIKWLLENILDPLAKWTISDLLPAFFDLLAETLDFLNPILEVFLELVDWLWEVFLEPIAAWTGGVIVDVLNGIADALSAIGDWMNEHKEIVEDFIIIIGSFAAAWGLVTLALNAWNIAVGIWNVVGGIGAAVTTAFGVAVNILTAPITLVILAIGALIAIVVLLIRNWNTVKVVAANCWAEIKKVWNTVASWFKANVITPLVNFFSNLWTSIKNTFSSVKTWFTNMFTGAWNGIKNAFSSVSSFFRGIWNTIKSMFTNIGTTIGNAIGGAFKNVVNSIITFAENTINGFIRAINGAIGLINKIPGVNIKQISTLNIPKLAKGGIIDSPTLAMVGERGKEAVMPLENNTGWITELAYKIADILKGSSSDSAGSKDAAIEIILKLGDTTFARAVIDSINKLQRQAGRTLIEI